MLPANGTKLQILWMLRDHFIRGQSSSPMLATPWMSKQQAIIEAYVYAIQVFSFLLCDISLLASLLVSCMQKYIRSCTTLLDDYEFSSGLNQSLNIQFRLNGLHSMILRPHGRMSKLCIISASFEFLKVILQFCVWVFAENDLWDNKGKSLFTLEAWRFGLIVSVLFNTMKLTRINKNLQYKGVVSPRNQFDLLCAHTFFCVCLLS